MSEEESNDFTLEVIELENDGGVTEDFVILDRISVNNNDYVLLASLTDVEELQEAGEEAWAERVEEGELMFLLKIDGEDYVEPEPDEVEAIQDYLTNFLDEED